MTHCEMCGDAPAAVSTPDWALCRTCHIEVRRQEQEDNVIPNFEACAECGGITERNGFCGWCDQQDHRRFVERIVRVAS